MECISKNPGMFVTQVYKTLKLSGYKGNEIRDGLIEKDMITQEETKSGKKGRAAKVLSLTENGTSALKKSPLEGKGGFSHKQFQMMFKEQAELYGWKAVIEEKIPGTIESVDVGLKKDDIHIAIEISVTTRVEQEIQNIRKCLDAGYDYIICVSEDKKKLASLKEELRKFFNILKNGNESRFHCHQRVINFLSTVSSGSIVSETSNVSEKIPKQKQLPDEYKRSC